ncbi:FAD-dependent oxidoreductase [Gracilibacillus massiliensis]|uniref:FAD-dependent oxidoreductase n=1 Tax=Gracilibacillus massiliensis TaxID=1564956 RepID=UPI00071DA90A|nr:FAD-dependent oxidoreductase [Gracilibacillus massiliensis]
MHKTIWQDNYSLKPFTALNESVSTEVTIVGGGMTGILAAYLLSEKGVNVVLLERNRLAQSTTGHTTAKVTAQHSVIYHELIEHIGLENTQLYYQSQLDAINLIKTIVDDYKIDCDFEHQQAILYTNESKNEKKLLHEAEAYQKLKISGQLQDELPFSIPVKQGLTMNDQAQFHPLAFLKVIVNHLVKKGVKIYENTTAVDIDVQEKTIVRTAQEYNIISEKVIVATQFPFYEAQAFYSTRMYPSRSYCLAFTSEDTYPGGMYLDIDQPKHSLRYVKHNGENIWILGGESHKTGQYRKEDDDPYRDLEKYANKHFPVQEWKYKWSAQDFTTLDKVPYIGVLNKKHPNVYVATGYRKWGMTNSAVAAQLLTDVILDSNNPYKEIYQPRRFHADPDVKKFVSYNTNVAKEFAKGKVTNTKYEQIEQNKATKTKIDGQTVGLYKDNNNQIHAVDTTCTHLGCECNWNQAELSWDCPCHGSRFSYDGKVIEGPATKDLSQIDL